MWGTVFLLMEYSEVPLWSSISYCLRKIVELSSLDIPTYDGAGHIQANERHRRHTSEKLPPQSPHKFANCGCTLSAPL